MENIFGKKKEKKLYTHTTEFKKYSLKTRPQSNLLGPLSFNKINAFKKGFLQKFSFKDISCSNSLYTYQLLRKVLVNNISP